jgi:hypothetical protein
MGGVFGRAAAAAGVGSPRRGRPSAAPAERA